MFTYLIYYILGIVLIPGIILGIYAQFKVKRTYSNYSQIPSKSGWTAAQVARNILDNAGLTDIELRHINGSLTDHYHPKQRYIGLSSDIYDSNSVAALGIAMHEVGHALQDKEKYGFLKLRQFMVPVTNIASTLLWPLVIIGLLLGFGSSTGGMFADICIYAGVGFFGLSVLLNLITLPVEFDASRRALALLEQGNILDTEELAQTKKVLSAAALTYVAAFVVSILEFLRFLLLIFITRNE